MLAVTPFLCLPGMDTRVPKMGFCVVMLSALCICSLYFGDKLERISNKWLAVFLGLLPLNIYLAPKLKIDGTGMLASHSYLFRTSMYIVLFVVGYLVIKHYYKETKDKNIFNIIIYSGLVMSVYCGLQALDYDQWFFVKDNLYLGNVGVIDMLKRFDSPRMIGGTMGHATIVGPFIGMIIPLALKQKRYIIAAIMVTSLILSGSCVALGALFVAGIAFIGFTYKNLYKAIFICGVVVCVSGVYVTKKIGIFDDSGRFPEWKQIYKAHKSPIMPNLKKRYPLTGMGVGSFKYIYPSTNKSTFHQAHNEYLEILYNHGLFGLVVFLLMILTWFIDNKYKCPYLLSSMVYISVCAVGTFVWHIAPIALYTITIKAITEVSE